MSKNDELTILMLDIGATIQCCWWWWCSIPKMISLGLVNITLEVRVVNMLARGRTRDRDTWDIGAVKEMRHASSASCTHTRSMDMEQTRWSRKTNLWQSKATQKTNDREGKIQARGGGEGGGKADTRKKRGRKQIEQQRASKGTARTKHYSHSRTLLAHFTLSSSFL